jgi:transcriptional regulator with XRE-family HTH domain
MPNKKVREIENSELFATMFDEAEDRDEFHVAGVKIEIAEQIYRMMEKRNLTQADLARKLGKKRAYISRILKGTNNFTLESLVLIARKLDAEWYFQLTDVEKPETKVYTMEVCNMRKATNMLSNTDSFCEEIGWEHDWDQAVKYGQ